MKIEVHHHHYHSETELMVIAEQMLDALREIVKNGQERTALIKTQEDRMIQEMQRMVEQEAPTPQETESWADERERKIRAKYIEQLEGGD